MRTAAIEHLQQQLKRERTAEFEKRERAEKSEAFARAYRGDEATHSKNAEGLERAIADLEAIEKRRALYGGRDPVTG